MFGRHATTVVCLFGLVAASCASSSSGIQVAPPSQATDSAGVAGSEPIETLPPTEISESTTTEVALPTTAASTIALDQALTSDDVNDDLCTAADDVYVVFRAFDQLEPGDDEALGTILTEAVRRAGVLDLASEDITNIGERIAGSTDVLFDVFESVEFQAERLTTSDLDVFARASDDLDPALVDLRELIDKPCFRTVVDFDEFAEAASLLGRAAATQISDTLPTVPLDPATGAIESVRIEDNAGETSVDVPTSWTNINPLGGRRLTAGPEGSRFEFDFGVRGVGMFIFSNEIADAAANAELMSESTVDEMIDRGCEVAAEFDFDNGRYTGREIKLTCVGSQVRSHVIVGTNAEQTISFLVGIARRDSEPGVRDLIADTFVID